MFALRRLSTVVALPAQRQIHVSAATQRVYKYVNPCRTKDSYPSSLADTCKPIRHSNILETVGDTPVVKLNKLSPPGTTVYAKAEFFNPLSSVKVRS